MKHKKLFKIKNYEELLAFSNDNLDIDDDASVTISVDLFTEVKENILSGKYKEEELDLIAPKLNLFFDEESFKLEKRTLRYFVPMYIKDETLEKKYKPFELMNDMDFCRRWLPVFLWSEIEEKVKINNWLNMTVECIDRRH